MQYPEIQIARWANYVVPENRLEAFSGERPIKMISSDGTAENLVLIDETKFGADVIRFAPLTGVATHTHPGDHILVVVKGTGYVEYNYVDFELQPGMIYAIPGNVPHAIKATTELVMLAIANDHRDAGSKDRLDIVERAEVQRRL